MIPSPISKIKINDRTIFVKREDLIHPFLSGNKYRKLKYNIREAKRLNSSQIISFGGAYSNHIHALSYICKEEEIKLKLLIRGERVSNPTLEYVQKTGAEMLFIDRKKYRKRNDPAFIEEILAEHKAAYIIPEGGSNVLALQGIREMMDEIYQVFDDSNPIHFCVSYGSGASSIGMLTQLRERDSLHIFPALKIQDFDKEFESKLDFLKVRQRGNVNIHSDYHFGGFAKFTPELLDFMNTFKSQNNFALDPIYTGKMFYGAAELIDQGTLSGDLIVLIHTGGLQGISGFNERFGNVLT